ncbi:MAG TPA: hypothetical protein VGO61_09265 [Steroidobacteraceae bacterium]|jgi:hypothetical protein|nr:hypothetical protein [Steroidobacteraceae bacterium]
MNTPQIEAHELRALWQRLPTIPVSVSPAEIRARAERLQAHIRRRNRTEYIATFITAAGLVWYASLGISWLWSAGAVLTALGSGIYAFAWHRLGRAAAIPDLQTTTLLDFHRAELARQRDALRSMWRLGLPMLPGITLLLIGWWNVAVTRLPFTQLVMTAAIVGLLSVVVVMWTTILQFAGAARFQRMLEELDRYRES